MCGAASGIGKSTFARAAFQRILGLLAQSTTDVDKELYSLLAACLSNKTLFRISYLDALLPWEVINPQGSLAFRLLFQFCKWRLDRDLKYDSFTERYPPHDTLMLREVVEFIKQELGCEDMMMVIHLDETNRLAPDYELHLSQTISHLYGAMVNKHVFIVSILTGTNAEYLTSLKESR